LIDGRSKWNLPKTYELSLKKKKTGKNLNIRDILSAVFTEILVKNSAMDSSIIEISFLAANSF